MTPLKMLLSLMILLLPGGSLVLLAIAIARALRATHEPALIPVPVPVRRRLAAMHRG